jgi:hypothetical protein
MVAAAVTLLAMSYVLTDVPRSMPAHALVSHRAPSSVMKDWSRRKTLAETEGGVGKKGAAAVGLTGTIPVVFEQGSSLRWSTSRFAPPRRYASMGLSLLRTRNNHMRPTDSHSPCMRMRLHR